VLFDAQISKPAKQAALYKCLRQILVNATPEPPSEAENSAPRMIYSGRVLVAEDNHTNQAVTRNMLELMGCSVDIVENGKDAVDAALRGNYDLVLMDYHMPVMDGCEATVRIRQHESARDGIAVRLPIVALSADVQREVVETSISQGMDDFLTKPVSIPQLSMILARFLPSSPVDAEAAAPATAAPDLEPEPEADPGKEGSGAMQAEAEPVLAEDAVQRLLDMARSGGAQILESILGVYLEESPTVIARLQQGLEEGDREQVVDAAHSLKSSSANVGAMRLSGICREIEQRGTAGSTDLRRLAESLETEFAAAQRSLEQLLEEQRHG